jgi:adenosylmethionine-8-amino-7-oxononanoate aminotransferase
MILAFDAQDVDRAFSRRFFANAVKNELLLRPIGSTVYVMPPYVLTDEEIDGLAQRTLAVFDRTLAEA